MLILPAFGGAGIMVLPSVLFGGLAVSRWDWSLPLRIALAVLAVAAALATVSTIPADGLPSVQAVVGIGLYPFLVWPLILVARIPLAPSFAPRAPQP